MVILVGKFGENHMTAGWVTLGYMHLSFMPAVGFSVAVSSLVGRYIGAGQPDIAAARARTGLCLAMVYMTICAAAFWVFREPMIKFFLPGVIDEVQAREIINIGGKLMICAALFQTVDAFGIIYAGALRGAGDTVWPGLITIIYSWGLIVGGGWLMTEFFPQLESLGPWVGAAVYIILLGLTMWWRFESGKWRNIDLLGKEQITIDAQKVAPVSPGPPASTADAAIRDFAESESEAIN